jgi:hypothetical protein
MNGRGRGRHTLREDSAGKLHVASRRARIDAARLAGTDAARLALIE